MDKKISFDAGIEAVNASKSVQLNRAKCDFAREFALRGINTFDDQNYKDAA